MIWTIKTFQELTTIDLYQILQLRNQIFVVEQDCVYQDCDGKDFYSYHLLGTDNNKIIAYLRIVEKSISYEEVSIGRVVVKESYRHKKIGRIMIQKAIDYIIQEVEESEIRISSQVYIKDFYASLGFKVVSEPYLEDNIPHVEMLYKKNT